MSFNNIAPLALMLASFLMIAPPALDVSAPTSVESGGTYIATGTSHAGESGTTIELWHDGLNIAATATIVWDGNQFTVTLPESPAHNPGGLNAIDIIVTVGNDELFETTNIIKN